MFNIRRDKSARAVVQLVSLIGICLGAALPARSQSSDETFKGKQIQLLVGFGAGGGYDLYARVVAQYLSRFIPGNPTISVQNMPGAGGLKVANYMYSQAPRDGTVIALTDCDLVAAPLLGLVDSSSLQYKPEKFFWLANLNSDASVAVFRSDSGVRSVTDLTKQQYVVGSTGLTANNGLYPNVMNNLLHTKLKVVGGYPGANALTLALERGEVQGVGGWTWSGIMVSRPQWIRDKTIVPVLQLSMRKLPELPDVPSILDYVKSDDARRALDLIFSPEVIGRPFFAPPGVPAKTDETLRTAFTKLGGDPDFQAAAKKARLELTFMDGAELDRLVRKVSDASPSVVKLAKEMIQPATTTPGTKAP